MRVVLDSNILVRANPKASTQGLARDLLLTIVSGPHVLVHSSAILVEVRRVLTYPRVQARWPLTGEAIEQYLVFLEAAGVLTELSEVSPAIVSDPDDDPILQTAIVGGANVLCTRDEAFQHKVVEQVCSAHRIRHYSSARASPVEYSVGNRPGRRAGGEWLMRWLGRCSGAFAQGHFSQKEID